MHGLLKVGTEKMAEPVHHFSDDGQYSLPKGKRHQVVLRLPEQLSHGLVVPEPPVERKHGICGQGQCTVGNLCVKVRGLAFAQSEILLALAEELMCSFS